MDSRLSTQMQSCLPKPQYLTCEPTQYERMACCRIDPYKIVRAIPDEKPRTITLDQTDRNTIATMIYRAHLGYLSVVKNDPFLSQLMEKLGLEII